MFPRKTVRESKRSGRSIGLATIHPLQYTRDAEEEQEECFGEDVASVDAMVGSVLVNNGYFADRALEVCFLPPAPWDDVLQIQQRLVYEIGDPPRKRAILLLTEHPPIITVGRQGSRGHILLDDQQGSIADVRWSNRGGGCWLQTPGQLAAYPIVPLEPQRFGLEQYRSALYETLLAVLKELNVVGERDFEATGVRVGDRQIGAVGVAVKNWVAYHGCTLNVSLPPDRHSMIQANPKLPNRKETCIMRERLSSVRPTAVRESFARNFASILGFRTYYLCPPPPLVRAKRPQNVAAR